MSMMQEILTKRAEKTPHLEALVGGTTRYTFKQYNERVNQMAHYLMSLGVQKGNMVGILCKNNHPVPTIMMAAMKIGAVPVPFSWQLTAFELEDLLQTAKPTVLFYDEEFAGHVKGARENQIVPHMIQAGKGFHTTEAYEQIFAEHSIEEPSVSLTGEDTAFMLFTSGTTGNAKGCMITHGGLDAYFKEAAKRPVKEGGRFLAVHPLFHMSGILNLFNSITSGITIIFEIDSTPKTIWDTIEREGIHMMLGFPSVYTYMLEELKERGGKPETFKYAAAGGTKVPASLIHEYEKQGISMMEGYGSTEAWVVSAWRHDMGESKADSVGKAVPGVQIKITDPETGETLPQGEVGEIMVKSPYVFKGYWSNEEATKQVFTDGWFHMGDAGKLDKDGFLYIMGRYKDVIVRGGDNVYPIQLEEIIQHMDGVLEVAVIGIPDDFWGEIPRAYVVKDVNSSLTEKDVIANLQSRVADYKVPQVEFIRELPKNTLGKIVKRDLKDLVLGVLQ
ncbi:class I adenylate-forming enzyme family protein [Priestia koreensis]|uniref:class I adenylate-forming enzyme family protein n=1 Tax=Priestia koreensis TaxID=284581 RepID=UPI001F5ADD35|nr:class I adenylate-forming enzyme family protein [Priestia koreensis]UNL86657.1 acyl--CoA ligase [Priestia koreensis]